MADDILKKASEKLGELISEKKNLEKTPEQEQKDFTASLAKVVVNELSALIAGLAKQSRTDSDRIISAIASIDVKVPPSKAPIVNVPKINVPTPKVTVNPPQIKVPQINVPKTEVNFPDSMDVRMSSVDRKQPLPVIMMDTKGKPMPFSQGASGGKADFLTIKNIITSTGASLITDDGKLKTDASVSVGDVTVSQDYGFGEVGSETVRTVQATDAVSSVAVKEIFGSTVTSLLNGDNRIPVSVETGGSGLTDSELRASSVPVAQASGAIWSTNVISGVQTDALTDTELRATSVPVSQVSGAVYSTEVTNEVTVSATDLDIRALQKDIDEVVTRPVSLRGNLSTAYVSLSTGTETTLKSAEAGSFLDLVWVTAANQSDAAVTIDLRDVSGGSVVATFEVPANATSGIAPAVPYPQGNQGNAWTVDMGDITGTTVDITALFSKE